LAEISWTREAQTWLRDIYDYIAADNLDAAALTVSGIYQRAQLLKQHPEIDTVTKRWAYARFESFSTVTIE
jgi:toxin ParE1/3/4